MKIRIVGVALFVLASMVYGQSIEELFGRWKVTAVADASPVTAISSASASRLIGQYLVLKPHSLQFAQRSCKPSYEISQETAADFEQDYKISAKTLKLPTPVVKVDGDCSDMFLREPGRIVFTWKGYFLDASKEGFVGPRVK
jgi:hypothetical protein